MAIFCSFRLFSHRFELVEWVAPAELNGDVACTMTDVGQSRHLGCEPISSGLHPTPDMSPRRFDPATGYQRAASCARIKHLFT
jgi:hypothetical protein